MSAKYRTRWRANRRDENELEIVKALEAAGASVFRLDKPCDLLVGFRGKNYLIEVKVPNAQSRGNRSVLTPKQREFFASWRGFPPRVVRSAQEAVDYVQAAGTPVCGGNS